VCGQRCSDSAALGRRLQTLPEATANHYSLKRRQATAGGAGFGGSLLFAAFGTGTARRPPPLWTRRLAGLELGPEWTTCPPRSNGPRRQDRPGARCLAPLPRRNVASRAPSSSTRRIGACRSSTKPAKDHPSVASVKEATGLRKPRFLICVRRKSASSKSRRASSTSSRRQPRVPVMSSPNDRPSRRVRRSSV
jgi:hypothetical protein